MRIGGKLNEFKKPTQHKNWVGFFYRGKYKGFCRVTRRQKSIIKNGLAVLLHGFFDPYPDSALLCLRELFAENRSALAAQNNFVFWGEAAVGFQYLLVVYLTAPEDIACAAAERESENISPATASSRGDATVMLVSFIFTCGARTSPSGINFAFSVARPAPVRF